MEPNNLPMARTEIDHQTLNRLITGGDCSRLTEDQKRLYYMARCEAAGLDYRATPFAFIALNGKTVLYALKGCAEQLAALHGIQTQILSQVTEEEGIRIVTVRVTARDGRATEDIGCVNVAGAKGDVLCNLLMKAITKAKRRAILSLCGLGMADESELETIPAVGVPEIPQVRETRAFKPIEGGPAVAEVSSTLHQQHKEAASGPAPQTSNPTAGLGTKIAAKTIAELDASFRQAMDDIPRDHLGPALPTLPEEDPSVLAEVEALDEKARLVRIGKRLMEMAGGEQSRAESLLIRYSTRNGRIGVRTLKSPVLAGERLVDLDHAVRDAYNLWKKEQKS